MKDKAKQLLTKFMPLVRLLRRYIVVVVFLVFAAIYTVLVLRVNHLAASEPTASQVNDKLSAIHRPRIDQQTLDKIQQLQDQNIQVKSLFDQARSNPFSE